MTELAELTDPDLVKYTVKARRMVGRWAGIRGPGRKNTNPNEGLYTRHGKFFQVLNLRLVLTISVKAGVVMIRIVEAIDSNYNRIAQSLHSPGRRARRRKRRCWRTWWRSPPRPWLCTTGARCWWWAEVPQVSPLPWRPGEPGRM